MRSEALPCPSMIVRNGRGGAELRLFVCTLVCGLAFVLEFFMVRALKNFLKRILFHIYRIACRFGLIVMPSHYYCPAPNVVELENTSSWLERSSMSGVDINMDEQCSLLEKLCLPFQGEYKGNSNYHYGVKNHFGPGFGYIEAQALHSVVRYYKPKRIIEVGSGVSTYCSYRAMEMNKSENGRECSLTCIEPYPSESLLGFHGIRLIDSKVQDVDLDVFKELEENDMLFIDSSHTVKAGSDVNTIVLEILPVLKPGVIVHFHDIFFPYTYNRNALKTFFHWNESSLLQAYLVNNKSMSILFCMSLLHYDKQEEMKRVFPEYMPQSDYHGLCPDERKPFQPIAGHFPSSLYLQVH